MKRIACLLMSCVGMILGYMTFGQDRTGNDETKHRVFVGQSVEDATKSLRACNVNFGEGGFAFAGTDPDLSNLQFVLDPNHVSVCAYFSRTQSVITRISLVCFPARKLRSKSGDAWISANEITLRNDRSYSVMFDVPVTEQELTIIEKKTQKNQIPQLPSSK